MTCAKQGLACSKVSSHQVPKCFGARFIVDLFEICRRLLSPTEELDRSKLRTGELPRLGQRGGDHSLHRETGCRGVRRLQESLGSSELGGEIRLRASSALYHYAGQ